MMSSRFVNVKIVLLIFIASQICVSNESEWNYESEGPDAWPYEYASCRGRLQSPINLEPTFAKYDPNLRPITFTNYEKSLRWDVKNNGHTSNYISIKKKKNRSFCFRVVYTNLIVKK